MSSRTLKFDETLHKILEATIPGKKKCSACGNEFGLFEEDIEFAKKLKVLLPRECPECRMRKRMAMMANIFQFYKKECSAHLGERVISQMSEDNAYKIYDNQHWWNLALWDPMSFGSEYDPNKKFQDQIVELTKKVPHRALARYNKNIINSEYTVDSFDVKNCYLSSTIGIAENISYGLWVLYSQNSIDLLGADHVQYSYEVVDSDHIYNSKYVQNSNNCSDSTFLFDCHNCQNCFGCVNLRNKKFCYFNEQLKEADYKERISRIDLGDSLVREDMRKKFDTFINSNAIFRSTLTISSPNSTGDHLKDCKNCFQSFYGTSAKWILTFYKNENVRYSQDFIGAKDCMDITIFGPGEQCYNVIEGLSVNKVISSYFIDNCLEVEYSFECSDCQYCFGCSGLRKKKYCILNKQYSEDQYWRLVDAIKFQLVADGVYGEFLSLQDSLFYYEDTYAQAILPMNREGQKKAGASLKPENSKTESIELKVLDQIPQNIKVVSDDILNFAIICDKSKKPFRILKLELDFYREHSIPIPKLHPQVRLMNRFDKRNPLKLVESNCSKCSKKIKTSYNLSKKLRIYCEQCYQAEVV